ncbi:MAG: shikimate kinase [Phototrophicaceae bacterium]
MVTSLNKQNIVLTGFMATGKSTVGASIANQLHRTVIDIDTLIEQRTEMSISQIFADYGEVFFRAVESGICHEVCMRNNLVIATGGGAIIDEANRNAFLQTSFVVCLTASHEAIESRLSESSSRPLASAWRAKLAARQAIYDAIPYQIDTSDLTPNQIAKEIILLWQNESLST